MDGRPPLYDFLDDPKCVKILIDSGAKLDLIDDSGKTAFHHASAQDESESLRLLLHHTDNLALAATKDHEGNTPLTTALSASHVECALTLLGLEDGGDIISSEGWAAVHYAARIGHPTLLEEVLTHGSFMKGMKTMDGKRADTVAVEAGTWSGAIKNLIRRYDYL